MTEPARFDRFKRTKLVLVLLDNKDVPSLRDGRSLWGLYKELPYFPGPTPEDTEQITVRPGFVTDLASIPRWASIILPQDGPWVKAAIIHDYLYATGGTGQWKNGPVTITRPTPYSREEADRILLQGMENRGVDVVRRTIIYLAVRVGGVFGWRRPRAVTLANEAESAARAEL